MATTTKDVNVTMSKGGCQPLTAVAHVVAFLLGVAALAVGGLAYTRNEDRSPPLGYDDERKPRGQRTRA